MTKQKPWTKEDISRHMEAWERCVGVDLRLYSAQPLDDYPLGRR